MKGYEPQLRKQIEYKLKLKIPTPCRAKFLFYAFSKWIYIIYLPK